MKYIAFYCHNFWGLWHARRLSSIIRELTERFDYRVLFINSGKQQDFLFRGLQGVKILNLPTIEINGQVLASSVENEKRCILRRRLLEKIMQTQNIESLVIEHFPFGRNFLADEITHLVWVFRQRVPSGRVFASIRDVVDLSALRPGYALLFDRILVHGDPGVYDIRPALSEYDMKRRVVYTGYVVDRLNPVSELKRDLVLINIWGGQDGVEGVLDFLGKAERSARLRGCKFHIFLGGQFDTWSDRICSDFSLQITCDRYAHDFLLMKASAALLVSMGGYNNMVESLAYSLPTIVYPREIDEEQGERLRIFSALSDRILDGRIATIEEIEGLLGLDPVLRSRVERSSINTSGAYFSASFLAGFGKYRYLKIRLTNACNAACDMCGVIRRKIRSHSIDRMRESIESFASIGGQVVNFTGGEPTVYGWFWGLLRLAKAYGMITSLSTNGSTLGDDFFREMYQEGQRALDFIDISIDGLVEKHDRTRKYPGLFYNIAKNLPLLKKHGVFIHINVTVRSDNIRDMPAIFSFFRDIWVDSISFGIIASSSHNDTSSLIPKEDDLRHFYGMIQGDMESTRGWCAVAFSPRFPWGDLGEFVQAIRRGNAFSKPDGMRCEFIHQRKEVRINEDGRVVPCCVLDETDIQLGNILEASLMEILCSPEYDSFLQRTFPTISEACKHCKIVLQDESNDAHLTDYK